MKSSGFETRYVMRCFILDSGTMLLIVSLRCGVRGSLGIGQGSRYANCFCPSTVTLLHVLA